MKNDVTRASTFIEWKSFREFDLQLCCVNKCKMKKASDDEKNQEHRNIAPHSLQLRSYKTNSANGDKTMVVHTTKSTKYKSKATQSYR